MSSTDRETLGERIVESIMNSETLWPGQLAYVTVRGEGRTVVRITKRNPKTYKSELPDGRNVTGPHSAFKKAEATAEFVSTKEPVVTRVSSSDYNEPGTMVRFLPTSPIFSKAGDKLHVVVACDRYGKHRIFPLGGSSRYWKQVPSSEFQVVPVENIREI